MALTVVIKKRFKFGNGFGVVADVTFGNPYTTGGGDTLLPVKLGLNNIDFVLPATAAGYLFEYDHANQKLKAMHPRAAITGTLAVATPALAHDTGATPVTASAASMPDHAAGGACTLSGVAAVAAGAGAEAGAIDMHLITVRIIAIGI
jgi:hypothetical protein